eukprot:symbB.v1.2.011136.t1/scaffold732.1/size241626/10
MPVPDVMQFDWAKHVVQQMTEEEKYRFIHGVGFAGFKLMPGYYVLGVPRLGIPCIKMQASQRDSTDGTLGRAHGK